MATTKLDRLNTLCNVLLDCKSECVNDAVEWQIYDDLTKRINDMIAEEQHRLGFMTVYSIVDGQASDELFTGTKEQCDTYVNTLLEGQPKMKGNLIIANI